MDDKRLKHQMVEERRAMRAAQREKMRKMYEQDGLTLRAIAAEFRITFQSVHQTLLALGVAMRRRGGRTGASSRRT